MLCSIVVFVAGNPLVEEPDSVFVVVLPAGWLPTGEIRRIGKGGKMPLLEIDGPLWICFGWHFMAVVLNAL